MAAGSGDTFRMKLHTVNVFGLMRKTHNQPVLGFGGDGKAIRQTGLLGNQGMIARNIQRRRESLENGMPLMKDSRNFPVHGLRGAHDLAAKRLRHRLKPEANAEQRNVRLGSLADQFKADPRMIGVARPWRDHYGVRRLAQNRVGALLIVAVNTGPRPQIPEILDKVVGKTVVIVDQSNIHATFMAVRARKCKPDA